MSNDSHHSEQYQRYLKGQMTPEEAHAFEREILDDPFAVEAMEGLESLKPNEVDADLLELRAKLFRQKSSGFWLKIAAAVALLVVGTASLWFVMNDVKQEALVMEEDVPENSESKPLADSLLAEQTPKEETNSIKETTEDDPPPSPEPIIAVDAPLKEEPLRNKEPVSPNTTIEEADMAVAVAEDTLPIEEGAGADVQAAGAEVVTETEEVGERLIAESLEEVATKRKEAVEEETIADEPSALRAAPKAQSRIAFSANTVAGKVTDERGEAIPGVNVVIKGTTTGTTTDLDGMYSIAVEANATLVFSFVGFETSEVEVGSRSTIDITIGGATELQEVINTAQEVKDKTTSPYFTAAKPPNGLKSYKKYLESNLRYPTQAQEASIEGRVVLNVKIDKRGRVVSVEVIKALGYGCDEEAIRLVQEGPDWIAAERDGVKVEDEVKVRVKFSLD